MTASVLEGALVRAPESAIRPMACTDDPNAVIVAGSRSGRAGRERTISQDLEQK